MIVHVGKSRSANFWTAIKAEDGAIFFGYGASFVGRDTPRVGQRVSFTPLPPIIGTRYPRATEIMIHAAVGHVVTIHDATMVKLVIRHNRREREVGEINLANV